LPHGFAHVIAAHSGQHQVEDDQVDRGGIIVIERQSLRAIADDGDEISFGL
jgi:hypothetical protein